MKLIQTKVLDMNLRDEILEDYNDFFRREGKVPNELYIPGRYQDEFEQIIKGSIYYQKPDPLGKITHWWFMGMRVFNEIFSFGVGWSEETENIKRVKNEINPDNQ